MKAFLACLLLLVAVPAQASGPDWRAFLPQLQIQGDPRQMPPPGGRERWEERQRLREAVRDGRMTRDDAVRHYRDRYPERPSHERRRMSHEEREQMRRDIHEANRNLRKR